jgi:hypothetical protein
MQQMQMLLLNREVTIVYIRAGTIFPSINAAQGVGRVLDEHKKVRSKMSITTANTAR